MGHLKIYEKHIRGYANGMVSCTVTQIVGCNLTDEQLQELQEYFDENHSYKDIVNGDYCYEVCNMNEIMEESPLPDGTVINANAFLDCQDYIVLISKEVCNKFTIIV